MTNYGGRILKAGVWQQAIPAGAVGAGGAIIQNTAFGLNPTEFDPNGVNDGPPILVWPFGGNPNDLAADGTNRVAGRNDGAFVCRRVGDATQITSTQTAAVWVYSTRGGATFAAATF